MNRSFSRMPDAIAELKTAIRTVKNPDNRFISRTVIETEISDNPGEYPLLTRMTGRFRKAFITNLMKEWFPVWGGSQSSKKGFYVWIVEETGVQA
jgi:hypothetical protein